MHELLIDVQKKWCACIVRISAKHIKIMLIHFGVNFAVCNYVSKCTQLILRTKCYNYLTVAVGKYTCKPESIPHLSPKCSFNMVQ